MRLRASKLIPIYVITLDVEFSPSGAEFGIIQYILAENGIQWNSIELYSVGNLNESRESERI